MKKLQANWQKKKQALAWLSVVAILIVATLVYFADNDGMTKEQRKVYYETKDALELLSASLNQGIRSVQYIKEYDKAKDKVFIENDSIQD